MTVDEVSSYLQIPVKTLYNWRTSRQGPPAFKIGKHLRYHPDDVVVWIDELRKASATRSDAPPDRLDEAPWPQLPPGTRHGRGPYRSFYDR